MKEGNQPRPEKWPSELKMETLVRAFRFKLEATALRIFKSRLPQNFRMESGKVVAVGMQFEKAERIIKDLMETATEEALTNFYLRNLRGPKDLARIAAFIAEKAISNDAKFFKQLSGTLDSGGKPWMDDVDSAILFNWEHNSEWHPWPRKAGELTLPDELQYPLKHWSDSAALEFVRYFSGVGHNLSESGYTQRRKRWGLHPSGQKIVKSAKIKLVKNSRTFPV